MNQRSAENEFVDRLLADAPSADLASAAQSIVARQAALSVGVGEAIARQLVSRLNDAAPLADFPFEGKNSLPFFTRFQKVFYLDRSRNICGYNNQAMAWFTGPGYYMVQMNPKAAKEIQIDYTRLPTEHPDGWPEIKSNMAFPTRFIYGGTKDNLRWVSKDVVIGRAYKMGETPIPNRFILCRKDPR